MRQGIKEKDIRDFEKYATKLVDVLRRIQEYKPEACAFLSEDTLNLLSDDHNKFNRSEQQNVVVTSVYMSGFDGGDW